MNEPKIAGFSRTVALSFEQPPELVTPYFEPDGRRFLYPWWQPELSVRPLGEGLAGMIQKVTQPPHTNGWGLVLIVHEHKSSPQQWAIYYSVLWGDYELQQIKITCRKSTSGGTDAIWQENTLALGAHGVDPVTEFVTTGVLQARVNAYRNAIDAHLKGGDPSDFIGHLQSYEDGVIPKTDQ